MNDDIRAYPRGVSLTRGRKFTTDELQLMVLHLLSERLYHGYELIKAFAKLSSGFYSPSPGALYPALAQLEKRGHTVVEVEGKRKRYRLSETGTIYLDANHDRVEQLFAILRHAAKRMIWMTRAMTDEAEATRETGWLPEFVAARQALKAALLTRDDASHEEQRRVTSILQSAAAAILQPGVHS